MEQITDLNKQQVLDEIGLSIQQCSMAGNNDSELPELLKMQKEVQADQVDPSDFVKYVERAKQIFDSKIDR